MEKSLDHSLSMFTTVKSVLNKYKSVWKDAVGFNTSVEQLLSNTTRIEDLSKGIESKTSGVTKLKNEVKAQLRESIFEATSQMQVYFKRIKDTVNLQKVKISKTAVKNLRENMLLSYSAEVSDLLNANLAALADFNITAEKAGNLSTLIARFKELVAQPRVIIVGKKSDREELEKLFRDTNLILSDELDKLMVAYKTTHPDFYNDYFNARKMVKYGTRHNNDDDHPNEDTNGNSDAPQE